MSASLEIVAQLWLFFVAAISGYLLGSIPFGLLLTRIAGLGDVRKIGSGNIGATNVLRTGNKGIAALTLLLDSGKGALAVVIVNPWGPEVALIAGAGAVVGHIFPAWLGFKGGKGVATGLGVLLAASWPVGMGVLITWLATALILRLSSLAALLAMVAAPVYGWWFGNTPVLVLSLFISLLVISKHRDNIGRLLRGEESRISFGNKSGNTDTSSD